MNIMGAFSGDYLQAVGFGADVPTYTIDHVKLVELQGEDGTTKAKPVVYFRGEDKGWVLCKTTAQSLAAMFGPETDQWTGRRVTLHAVDVQVGAERKPGIRVKGSPDLKEAVTFELRLPKRRPQKVTLVPTGDEKRQASDVLNAIIKRCQEVFGEEAKVEWKLAWQSAGLPDVKATALNLEQLHQLEVAMFPASEVD